MSKLNKSRQDSEILSKITILEDNENKLKIISEIKMYKKKLENHPSDSVCKNEVLNFVNSIEKCIQKSHKSINSTLPHGSKKYKNAMNRLLKSDNDAMNQSMKQAVEVNIDEEMREMKNARENEVRLSSNIDEESQIAQS